jgi:hypothetical protein
MAAAPSQHDPRLTNASRGSADRRRAGAALTAYGVVGLFVVLVGLIVVSGVLDGDRGPFGLDVQRRAIGDVLESSSRTLEHAEAAARDADASLTGTAGSTGDGSLFVTQLGGALRTLSSSLRISLFGGQPFAAPAGEFERVAGQADRVAADLDRAASSMRLTSHDLASIATELAAMRADVDRLRDETRNAFEVGPWRLMLALLLVWLAIPAAVSLAFGLDWWRPEWTARVRDRRHRVR